MALPPYNRACAARTTAVAGRTMRLGMSLLEVDDRQDDQHDAEEGSHEGPAREPEADEAAQDEDGRRECRRNAHS